MNVDFKGPPFFASERIQSLCRPTTRSMNICTVMETGSTNSDLLAQLDQLGAPTVLIAHTQTAGRGRSGKKWHSTDADALTFSLAWPFHSSLQQLMGLPLVVGIALAHALHSLSIPVSLKWPNDVLKEGKKLAGILVETAISKKGGGSSVWAVIGVGINLAVPASLEHTIGHAVADARWLAHMDRDVLIATLLDFLSEALIQFQEVGFAPFQMQWNVLHAFQNQQVVVVDKERVLYEGIALGVDATGRLVLETQTGQKTVLTGDVSLRIKDEYAR